MSARIVNNVTRPAPVTIHVNDTEILAYEGESLATALFANGWLIMSRDASGRARSPYCNMGVCFDCMVDVVDAAGSCSRVRACMTVVRPGVRIKVAAQ
ncbi:MAG TPA: (2Fe-2S)-binding protein [Povalibacter sp.]|nr:(2Fe-2S)-binding protein [Povalibacter sp.]